ncbi:hypothetical protein ACFE04_009641 [Oxalis oulophora]
MASGPGLESLLGENISVITNDGRNIVGILKGFDQATNIILDESHERVYSTKEGVQQLVLGLYIIRGDNISVVGEIDHDLDESLDLSALRAHPLKPYERFAGLNSTGNQSSESEIPNRSSMAMTIPQLVWDLNQNLKTFKVISFTSPPLFPTPYTYSSPFCVNVHCRVLIELKHS